MRYRELIRKLRNCGCEFDRQAKGSHEIWINPINRKRTTVQDWGAKDLPEGTIRGVIRDLAIDKGEFDKA